MDPIVIKLDHILQVDLNYILQYFFMNEDNENLKIKQQFNRSLKHISISEWSHIWLFVTKIDFRHAHNPVYTLRKHDHCVLMVGEW